MPYPQDLVGKYIAYAVNPGANWDHSMAPNLVNGVLPGQTTAATVAVYTKPGAHFVNTGVPWNFSFHRFAHHRQ